MRSAWGLEDVRLSKFLRGFYGLGIEGLKFRASCMPENPNKKPDHSTLILGFRV